MLWCHSAVFFVPSRTWACWTALCTLQDFPDRPGKSYPEHEKLFEKPKLIRFFSLRAAGSRPTDVRSKARTAHKKSLAPTEGKSHSQPQSGLFQECGDREN